MQQDNCCDEARSPVRSLGKVNAKAVPWIDEEIVQIFGVSSDNNQTTSTRSSASGSMHYLSLHAT